jgi:hypothetical protein
MHIALYSWSSMNEEDPTVRRPALMEDFQRQWAWEREVERATRELLLRLANITPPPRGESRRLTDREASRIEDVRTTMLNALERY